MIWIDVRSEHGAKALDGMINASQIVSISQTFDRTKCVVKTTREETWICDTPYDELRKSLRALKNKENT